jgi:hypothetical protein
MRLARQVHMRRDNGDKRQRREENRRQALSMYAQTSRSVRGRRQTSSRRQRPTSTHSTGTWPARPDNDSDDGQTTPARKTGRGDVERAEAAIANFDGPAMLNPNEASRTYRCNIEG